MKKTLVAVILISVLLLGMAGGAMADSFYFIFNPDDNPIAGYTSYSECDGKNTAYVDPGVSIDTAYGLLSGNTYVSNTLSSTGSRKSFTYKSGYGGAGNRYRMIGAPNMTNGWDTYHVSGTWKP